MNTEERGVRLDQFMIGIKWMLCLLGLLAVLSFVVTLGSIADSRKQTAESILDIQKKLEVIRTENNWSKEDRSEIHQFLGRIEATLKGAPK